MINNVEFTKGIKQKKKLIALFIYLGKERRYEWWWVNILYRNKICTVVCKKKKKSNSAGPVVSVAKTL